MNDHSYSTFRRRAVELVRSGRPVDEVSAELLISRAELQKWVRQDRVDRGELAGVPTGLSEHLQRKRMLIRWLDRQLMGWPPST